MCDFVTGRRDALGETQITDACLVTTESNPLAAAVHERMPATSAEAKERVFAHFGTKPTDQLNHVVG